MNIINPVTSELMLATVGNRTDLFKSIVVDNGEKNLIEGRHVSVDNNSQEVNSPPYLNIPSWLVGEYA